MVMTRYVKSVI